MAAKVKTKTEAPIVEESTTYERNTVNLPDYTWDKLKEEAKRNRRTLSAELEVVLDELYWPEEDDE